MLPLWAIFSFREILQKLRKENFLYRNRDGALRKSQHQYFLPIFLENSQVKDHISTWTFWRTIKYCRKNFNIYLKPSVTSFFLDVQTCIFIINIAS